MSNQNMPVIDWNAWIQVAGKEEYALEMLDVFMKNIEFDLRAIQEAYVVQNFEELKKIVHKLHGALCYCGLPRLKKLVSSLESALKKHIMVDLPSLLNQLHAEVILLIEHYSLLPQRKSN